mmetsp:Transcript_34527/g.25623  ORF Transcript_34527/g.25623 Transcript_34527/m.25623 type:complete len:95 (-) Transcript_34527:1277-1561(-)
MNAIKEGRLPTGPKLHSEFGFDKTLVALTEQHKVVAFSSFNGKVLWGKYFGTRGEALKIMNVKLSLLEQRHFGVESHLAVILKDRIVMLDPRDG